MKRKVIIVLTFICMVLVLIIYFNTSDEQLNRAVKYSPNEIQKDIIEELSNSNIAHRVSEDGYLFYKYKDEVEVFRIIKKVEQLHSQKLPNTSYYIPEHQALFLRLLDNANIPYKIKKLDAQGHDYVTWEYKYDDKVQEIISQVNKKIGFKNENPSISFQLSDDKDYFLELMNKENIPYRFISNELTAVIAADGIKIEYNNEDRKRVQELLNQVFTRKGRIKNGITAKEKTRSDNKKE